MKSRNRLSVLPGLLLLAVLAVGRPSFAAGPLLRSWKTYGDFLTCRLENLSLESSGRLVLARQARLVIDSGEPYIWDIASDPTGALFLATGNRGRLFRVAANGDTSLCFTAGEPEIYALAEDGHGNLYIATSPHGRIYRRDPAGAVRVFCEPGQTYIWDMLFDRSGNLWVATGGKARLLCVDPAGQISMVLESEAEHLRCLAREGETLYAGSSRPGLIYRIRKNDPAFVLYDTGVEEVHSLAALSGSILYAAIRSAGVPAAATEVSAPGVTIQSNPGDNEETEKNGVAPETMVPAAGESPAGFASQLVRIDAEGYGRPVWPADAGEVQSLLADPEGGVLVGSGRDGRLYRIDPNGDISLLLQLSASQIPVVYRTANGALLLGTANMGLGYRLAAPGPSGRCESEPVDAGTLSYWGALSWRGQGSLRFETRSGNTRKPEASWSPWQPLAGAADDLHIVSPAARFLQWRCTLTTGRQPAELREVTLACMQKNRPPEIDDLLLLPPGDFYEAGQEPDAVTRGISEAGPLPKRESRKGFRTALWQFSDPNHDPLLFTLWYRRVEDRHWRRLAGPLAQILYAWDTSQMADGDYLLRLAACDSLTLPLGQGLRTEKISPAFLVDNSAPRIEFSSTRQEGDQSLLGFKVCDAASAIAHVRVSINAGGWQTLYPVDGICDSLCEAFLLPLPGGPAPLEISVEAADQLENTGTAHHLIKGF